MSPRPLPRRPLGPIWRTAESRSPSGPARRTVDSLVGDLVILLVFSAFAAIPMRLIVGSWTPWTFLVGAIATATVLLQSAYIRRRRARIALGWMEAGWLDVTERAWPWDANRVLGSAGTIQIRFAKSHVVRGFPVTVVDAFWVDSGVGGAARSFSGSGTIIVVRLPRAYPPLPGPVPGSARVVGDELYAVVDERPFTAHSATAAKQPPLFRPMPLARVPEHIERVLAYIESLGIRPVDHP